MRLTKKLFFIMLLIAVPLIVFSYNFLDRPIASYIYMHRETYHPIGRVLSLAGESQWYIGAGLLGFLFFKYKKKNELYKNRFLFLFYANVFSGLLSIVLKWIFSRVRPKGLHHSPEEYGFLLFQNYDKGFLGQLKQHYITMIHHPSTYASFPSGHTVTIAATLTVIYLLFPRYLYFWIILGVTFASGRVLAGDHFVSDIMAGGVVGVLATLFIYDKMKKSLLKI